MDIRLLVKQYIVCKFTKIASLQFVCCVIICRKIFSEGRRMGTVKKTVKDLNRNSKKEAFSLLYWWKGGGLSSNPVSVRAEYLEVELDESMGKSLLFQSASHFITYAIYLNDMNFLEDLHKKGANINIVDESLGGMTPLQYACTLGRADMVKKLLAWDADIKNVKVEYAMDRCKQPYTYIWGLFQQKVYGHNIDYQETRELIEDNVAKLKIR
jgi:hypothetical protein